MREYGVYWRHEIIVSFVVASLAVMVSACQTTGNLGSPGETEDTVEAGRISQNSYSFFYDQGDHLENLVEEKKFDDAAQLYAEQEEFFSQEEKRKKLHPLFQQIAGHYNNPLQERVATAIKSLKTAKWPLPQAKWAEMKATLTDAKILIGGYPDTALFTGQEFRLPAMDQLIDTVRETENRLKGNLDIALQAHDLFDGVSFFSAYPAEVDALTLLSRNFDSVANKLDHASKDELERFIKAYPPQSILPVSLYDRASRAYEVFLKQEAAISGAPRLAQALAVLRNLTESGFKQVSVENEKIGFIEVTSKTLLNEGQIEFPAAIDTDFPISAVKQSLDGALTDPEGPVYLIVFDVALAKATRRVIEKKSVSSKFQTGTMQKPNPEYNVVQNEVSNARLAVQQASMSKMSTDSQFCEGWGCLAKAVGQIAAAAGVDKAQTSLKEVMSKLNNTPMTLSEPIYAKYQYDVASVKAQKRMTVHYYIIDKEEETLFKSSFDVVEKKSFEVAYRVHEDDPGRSTIISTNKSEEDVVAWEEAPSSVKLSQLVAHYTGNVGAVQKLPAVADLRREMLQDKNKALANYRSQQFDARPLNDPRFDHVVVVYTGSGALGSGFFVKPDIVLTNWHVVGEGKFVEMKMYDGQETFGKVLAKDARLDLALIRVQSRGKPVTFFQENRINLGETVEAIGHPKGLDFSITRGVISSLRTIQRDGGKDVLFIQTDTPINKGNSGGPLFMGNKVVGVNTLALAKNQSEGLNFSVHYSEVLAFLKEYLPAFQVSERRP